MAATRSPSVSDATQERQRARDERGMRSSAQARADRLPPPPRERRPMLAALAILLVVGGAAAAGLLALRADERVPMLVAAREISAGVQITAADLATAQVAAEGIDLIPASASDQVIGQYAQTTIPAGQLLHQKSVTDQSYLREGKVAVGASLDVGRTPASGLQSGDLVQLVRVTDGTGEVLVDDAVVSSSRPASDGASGTSASVVTFIVDTGDGAAVTGAAAAGELSAVLVSRGVAVGG